MPSSVQDILCELISIPSVNPMGRTDTDQQEFERPLTQYLEDFFAREGLPFIRQTVHPMRDNIVAWTAAGRSVPEEAPVILWEVHQDTVPVDGMTIDPFGAQTRDGRIYGRGACDVKGGMAAMLFALRRLNRGGATGMPMVVLACTVNEEFGFTGATALCELWRQGGPWPSGTGPDVAIVAEPTDANVVVAHKGVLRWRCHTRGRAAHSSRPHLGENAIYGMSHVVQALERYDREVAPQIAPHPRCGQATLCVSTIAGGISVNTVPDRVTVEIDRRLLPDEDPLEVHRNVQAYVAHHTPPGVVVEHDPPYSVSSGLSDRTNGALADALCQTVRDMTGSCERVGVPYGTDAAAFAAAGVPAVVFGPGSIEQAHTADEWIDLVKVEQASEVLYQFACRYRTLVS